MTRRLFPLLLLVLLVACSSPARGDSHTGSARSATVALQPAEPSAAAAPAPAAAPPASAPVTTAEPSGANALRHAQVLAGEIGPRPAGSAAERTAADYIAGRLREFGYEVELQQFPIKTFVSRSVEFRVLAPQEEALRVAPLANSAPGAATGELYFAGLGYPSDYPSGGIGGRIALVQRGEIYFGEKARTAAAAGAAAVVIFDPKGDVIAGTLTGDIPPIPTISIPGAAGMRLRDSLRSGPVRVSLAFDGGVEEATATNIIGRPPGQGCAAVVGGHYDTVPPAPGASDNATGTAAVLELARMQGLRGNPEQACFIAFGAEELGLLGSMHFVSTLSDLERQAVRFMLNFDMVAVGDEWLFIGSRALQRRAQEVAASIGVEGRSAELAGASSDHASFIDRKIPALMLHRSNDPLLHTPEDTVDRVAAEPLETAVRLGLAFLTAFGAG